MMRDSTLMITTFIRLVSLGYWSWACVHLLIWITHPLARRIDPWGSEVFDPRRPVTIVGCVAAGAILYAISLPLARRIVAKQDSPPAFAFAFCTIRIVAFLSLLFSAVWISLALFELLVRRLTEHLPGQVHYNEWWLLRRAFGSAFPLIVLGFACFLCITTGKNDGSQTFFAKVT
jgi:hypothetical protein